MDPADSARLETGKGIAGNANQGGRRQVTLIEREIWQEMMSRLKGGLPPSARRANLLVSGISLAGSRGRTLRIGNCRIRIFGETKPCERMEEALAGLRDEMYSDWRGGAFGEVIADGSISVGDPIAWETSEE